MIVIVLMNVLIAIVSDSFDDAITRADELYWCSRLDLIAEADNFLIPGNWDNGGSFPPFLVKGREELLSEIKEHMLNTKAQKRWEGKVVESVRRIETDAEFKAKRIESQLNAMKLEVVQEVQKLLEEQRTLLAPLLRKEATAQYSKMGMVTQHQRRNQRRAGHPGGL